MKNQLFKISPDLKITLEILNQFGPKTPQTETTKTLTTKEKLELKRYTPTHVSFYSYYLSFK